MYPPRVAAEITNLSNPTIRNYARKFKKYLSPSANRKPRTYTEKDISILIKIRELTAAGIKLKDVPAELDKIVDTNTHDQNALALPGIIASLETIAETLNSQDSRLDRLERLAQDLQKEQSKSFWDRLRGR